MLVPLGAFIYVYIYIYDLWCKIFICKFNILPTKCRTVKSIHCPTLYMHTYNPMLATVSYLLANNYIWSSTRCYWMFCVYYDAFEVLWENWTLPGNENRYNVSTFFYLLRMQYTVQWWSRWYNDGEFPVFTGGTVCVTFKQHYGLCSAVSGYRESKESCKYVLCKLKWETLKLLLGTRCNLSA